MSFPYMTYMKYSFSLDFSRQTNVSLRKTKKLYYSKSKYSEKPKAFQGYRPAWTQSKLSNSTSKVSIKLLNSQNS